MLYTWRKSITHHVRNFVSKTPLVIGNVTFGTPRISK